MIIGRKTELERLKAAKDSEYSEFIAVYGRRRVGKTFLIKEAFGYEFAFHHTGKSSGGRAEQLDLFAKAMIQQGFKVKPRPKTWSDAFFLLENALAGLGEGKKVVFLDELPWMDTPKSDFLSSLEHFWNGWASMRRDIVLIVCGSATSWIVKKVLRNHGGLHNRITCRIRLTPFTLGECERFAAAKGLAMSRLQILEAYMILGGIPFYWDLMDRSRSLDQNIDRMFFDEGGDLDDEFEQLYAALFKNPDGHIAVVTALAEKRMGMTRSELLAESGLTNNGGFSKVLSELTACGFVRKYNLPGKAVYDAVYQLIDNYTLFYFKFLKGRRNVGKGWSSLHGAPVRLNWCGLAFEMVCLEHVEQIKRALGISGVRTQAFAWRSSGGGTGDGAQIDMLIDRADDVVNICEMKYSADEYAISGEELRKLFHRRELFIRETKTRKAVQITMVTAGGLAHNAAWNEVQNEVGLEDLFI